MKKLVLQLARTMLILLFLMFVVAIVMIILGRLQLDSDAHHFGIINSSRRGLPSYFNPVWDLVEYLQFVATVALPLVLAIFYKKLRLPILPLLLSYIYLIVIGLAVDDSLVRFSPFDESVSSAFASFMAFEVLSLVTLLQGYATYFIIKNYRKTQKPSG